MYLHLKYKEDVLIRLRQTVLQAEFEKEDLYDTDLELCIEGGKYRQTFILLIKIILNGFEWFSFQEIIIRNHFNIVTINASQFFPLSIITVSP